MSLEGIGFGYRERAPYACDPASSRGRLVPELESPTRTPFQRDRDRIIHSTAFRRLKHKTQVFIAHEGDHYRTRLTHTIEVAQIARALARALRLDEDLAEAVALVHDFGHTPFGHTGEDALNERMKDYGGFDHNAQSLRIVTKLEHRYADFDGLNLSWETLEGLVKHNGPLVGPHAVHSDEPVPQPILDFNERYDLELGRFASLEAQCAAIADDIAYNAHDIDDGLRAGLLTLDALDEVPLTKRLLDVVRGRYPNLDAVRTGHELVRRQITIMVEDVIAEAQRRLAVAQPQSLTDIHNQSRSLVAFSPTMRDEEKVLKRFLFKNLYFHDSVVVRRQAADKIVQDLFDACFADPSIMPPEWQSGCETLDIPSRARRVADYLAGMTDNFAVREHRRLFDHTPDLA
ncbi:deoxyguanosinetriphosphate triphosphohydrolase [Ochrobactrum soli]|uniref:Deoxyguanosinetriphosphate triphosphohydrolase-like protein n=1 Tax=Ochrobactrum teleogrylli TaxID=2479765 RepID=A0ABD5JWV6_9HYPH|nr:MULTISPECIES: deoxyguanosinetriphosphate triphosphohydrolase [Brucella]RLL76530.1 deoxyguanosinetriphosphate triphosphohydrolase [[Ochrobactrum] soli]RRD25959.1 deoxyguanosinetriphosphate triphosphohydrolase [Brucellaceae bacterium VT-16-1752]WHS30891.1 deoxyguanosinetriphosphate triphosphohydrolase [Brucella sp. NM4]WHT42644.1 deoxyguanosinetriphosphate triphosphohydrolase [Ochrobactrum sp. SSR]